MSELDLEERMRRMEFALFGIDGSNGVRADLRALHRELADLRRDIEDRREAEREEREARRKQEFADRKADRRMTIQILAGFLTALVVALIGLAQAGVFA